MPYPPHVLLAWGGSLHGVEQWTSTVRMVPNAAAGPVTDDQLEAFLPDLETDLTIHYNQPFFHTGLRVEWCKANNIGPTGAYASPDVSHTRFFAAAVPGTAADPLPAQISCVATLLTAADRGLANKGRIYFGGLSASKFSVEPATGQISVLQRDAFANHCKVLMNNLNNSPGLDAAPGLDVHVVSKGVVLREGVARKVTAVKVGRVLDTQRRRRENLPEDYSAPLPVT
jgi:hypothetical protein